MGNNNANPRAGNNTVYIFSGNTNNPDIVPPEVLYYFLFVNLWGPGLMICLFGVVTNILNIITFIKQGVKDTVNINLLGLATSDLASQISLFFANICFNPAVSSLDLPFVITDVMYMFSWCHIMFTRITTLITAFITLERCICVAAPLKVRNIFTPKRTILSIVFVYTSMLACVSPCFYTARPAWVFDPSRNKTRIGFSFIENRNKIENVTFITNNAIPTVAFCLVICSTAVLVKNLKEKSKWRKTSTTAGDALSTRDTKVGKMVVLISSIFIACYFPGTAIFIWLILDTEMRFDRTHVNQLFAVYSVLFNLESINASVNIFIYLSMSSKFKNTFLSIFSVPSRRKKTSSKTKYFQKGKVGLK